MKVTLTNKRKSWFESEGIYTSGFAFFEGQLYKKQAFNELFLEVESAEQFSKLLQKLNGHFAVIGKHKSGMFAAVDIVRSIPLFYDDEQIEIRDQLPFNLFDDRNSVYIKKQLICSIEQVAGTETLSKFKQLLAGQFAWFSKSSLRVETYKSHLKPNKGGHTLTQNIDSLTEIIDRSIDRLIEYAGNRKVIIPLSGGYDSRLILAALVKRGFKNVSTYTYGVENAYEAQIAKKVANQLSLNWQFIPYSKDLFQSFFTADYQNYFEYASNLVSVPQEQDFFALKQLKSMGQFGDAVFVPGYCGDFYAGSFVPDKYFELKWKRNPISVSKMIASKHLRENKLIPKNELQSFFIKYDQEDKDYLNFISHYEEWAVLERIAKYAVNGLRAYEYHGFDWYMPLWDQDFVAFFDQVDLVQRQNRLLYNKMAEDKYFDPLGINFLNSTFDSKFQYSGIRSQLRHVLPKTIKTVLKSLFKSAIAHDINQLDQLGDLIAEQLGMETGRPVNEMMGHWLIHRLSHLDQIEEEASF